jgi:hypothetical protein
MADANWITAMERDLLQGRPVTSAPVEVEPTPAPVVEESAPAATATAATPMNPSLRNFLLQYVSGYNVLPQEMYDLYGGDEILRQLQQYDPSAKWVPTATYGGEGGDGPMGYRLEFDPRALPAVDGPGGGKNFFETGLAPVHDGEDMYRGEMVYEDPIYGTLTPRQNIKKAADPWWTYAAPLAVGVLAPWAAGGLAAAGVGGTAGLTGAVTGSGVAAAAGGSPWWAQALRGLPNYARQIDTGTFNPATAAINVGASYLGVPPEYTMAGNLAANAVTAWRPKDYGGSMGGDSNGGSQKKVSSNESQLVANNFADDPYRFSN